MEDDFKATKFDVEVFLKNIRVNKNDPMDDLSDNAGFLAYYGYQQALWEGTANTIKLKLKTEEALASKRIRENGGKHTVESMKAEVAIDEEVLKQSKRLVVAQTQDSLYTNAIKSFSDRGNNVRSIGTWLRAERGNTTGSFSDSDTSGSYSREERAEVAKRLANRD